MKMEIGTEAAPFPEKKHISIIFVAVHPIDDECQGMFHQLSAHGRGQYKVEGGSRARICKRLRLLKRLQIGAQEERELTLCLRIEILWEHGQPYYMPIELRIWTLPWHCG